MNPFSLSTLSPPASSPPDPCAPPPRRRADLLDDDDFLAALDLARKLARAAGHDTLGLAAMLAGVVFAQRGRRYRLPMFPSPSLEPVVRGIARSAGLDPDKVDELLAAPADPRPMKLAGPLREVLGRKRRGRLASLRGALLRAIDPVTGCLLDDRLRELYPYAQALEPQAEPECIGPAHYALAALEMVEGGAPCFGPALARHLREHAGVLEAWAEARRWVRGAPVRSTDLLALDGDCARSLRACALGPQGEHGVDILAIVNRGITEALEHEQQQRVALHEAGHAVVSLQLRPGWRIAELSIEARGNGLGRLRYRDDNPRQALANTRADLLAALAVDLAGRAAQRHAAGDEGIDCGAADDLEQATRRAWQAVTRHGFDDSFGPVSLAAVPAGQAGWLGQQAGLRVRALLADAERRANEIVESNWPQVQALAEALLDMETLSEDDVIAIVHPDH